MLWLLSVLIKMLFINAKIDNVAANANFNLEKKRTCKMITGQLVLPIQLLQLQVMVVTILANQHLPTGINLTKPI